MVVRSRRFTLLKWEVSLVGSRLTVVCLCPLVGPLRRSTIPPRLCSWVQLPPVTVVFRRLRTVLRRLLTVPRLLHTHPRVPCTRRRRHRTPLPVPCTARLRPHTVPRLRRTRRRVLCTAPPPRCIRLPVLCTARRRRLTALRRRRTVPRRLLTVRHPLCTHRRRRLTVLRRLCTALPVPRTAPLPRCTLPLRLRTARRRPRTAPRHHCTRLRRRCTRQRRRSIRLHPLCTALLHLCTPQDLRNTPLPEKTTMKRRTNCIINIFKCKISVTSMIYNEWSQILIQSKRRAFTDSLNAFIFSHIDSIAKDHYISSVIEQSVIVVRPFIFTFTPIQTTFIFRIGDRIVTVILIVIDNTF